jgi:hypothetical protein
MHNDNPFSKIKDYWGSYYSSITEGAVKGLLNDMGYYFTDEGEHAGKWVHEKTGKALSDKHAMDIAAERAARKPKAKKKTTAAGPNPTDKDARKQDDESTHSEEVEYDGEELEESGRFRPSSPRLNRFTSRGSLSTGDAARGVENGLPGPDNSPYGRARVRSGNIQGNIEKIMSILNAKDRGADRMLGREFGSSVSTRTESLFQKDSDRLLREHIRAEYEARGIYPTSREVQETYNTVMDLIEKRKSYKQSEASLMLRQGASGKEVKDTIGRKRTPEGKSGNALLRRALSNAEYQGMMQGHITDDNDQPLLPRIEAHKDRRGVPTKISPSSPARKQSEVEKDTRFLMGQGFSPNHLRRIMSDSGR